MDKKKFAKIRAGGGEFEKYFFCISKMAQRTRDR